MHILIHNIKGDWFFSDSLSYLGNVDASTMGLPASNVAHWKSLGNFSTQISEPSYPPKARKNPEVPLKNQYESDPGQEFWDIFPFVPLPG